MINDPRSQDDIAQGQQISSSPLDGSNQVFHTGTSSTEPVSPVLGTSSVQLTANPSTPDPNQKQGTVQAEATLPDSSFQEPATQQVQQSPQAVQDEANGNQIDDQISQDKNAGKMNFISEITKDDYKGKTISEILKEKGKINPVQYQEIQYAVASRQGSEEDLIKGKGWVSEDDIVKAKAASYGLPFVDLSEIDIPRDLLTKLPYEVAQTHRAIVFKEDNSFYHAGMVDPLDIQRVNYIHNILGKTVKTYFASLSDVQTILDTKYAGQMETEVTEAVEEVGEGVVKIEESLKDISEIESTIASAPVARIVNMILEYAVKYEASDVHIEPREKRMGVRFRINGVMMERLQLPTSLIAPVVSRIKILSNLKIDEHRVPQDGRFQIKVGEKEIDLRVSVMPTVNGEKVVIRLLEKGGGLMKLEDTGIRGAGYKMFREALTSTQGILLVTGPTGSGKTQTLASSLLILNKPDVNIVTLEDPVEIKVEGVNQIQINADVGLTFAKGLRSVLRQDPDIIMVGEIRDEETAELAVQASLTGHLVLATLHTNSASGALPRLLDMHVEPYLMTSTVNVIVGQRLVRTLCDSCKLEYKASDEVVKMLHKVLAGLKGFDMYSYPKNTANAASPGQVSTMDVSSVPPRELEKQQQIRKTSEVRLYRAKGCGKCNNTGYSGRIGIFEVLKVSDKVSQMIMEHRSSGEIEKEAIQEGMITMTQDGFLKALDGITTVEEVLRVQKK
ncbi:MAG: GspE/PulE family protein [Patescibacteria group bacterium]|nr:GspE/PulE family protein [Patescibacteria group bacterium]